MYPSTDFQFQRRISPDKAPQFRQQQQQVCQYNPYTQHHNDQENIPPVSQYYNQSSFQQVQNANQMSYAQGNQLNGYHSYNVDVRFIHHVPQVHQAPSSGPVHGQCPGQSSMSPPRHRCDMCGVECNSEDQLSNHVNAVHASTSSAPVTTATLFEHFSDEQFENSAMNRYTNAAMNLHRQEESNILDLDAHKTTQQNVSLQNGSNYQSGGSVTALSWGAPIQPITRPYVSPPAPQVTYTQASAQPANSPARASQQAAKTTVTRRPKNFQCTTCNKGFTSSGHLKRHYNTNLHKNALRSSGQSVPAAASTPCRREAPAQLSPAAAAPRTTAQPQPHYFEFGNNNEDYNFNINMLNSSPQQGFHQMTNSHPSTSVANQVASSSADQLIRQAGPSSMTLANMSSQPLDTVAFTLPPFSNFVNPYSAYSAVETTPSTQGFGEHAQQTMAAYYSNSSGSYTNNQSVGNQTSYTESSSDKSNGSNVAPLDQSGSSTSDQGCLPSFAVLQPRNYNGCVQNDVNHNVLGEGTSAAFVFVAPASVNGNGVEEVDYNNPQPSTSNGTPQNQSQNAFSCQHCDKTFTKACYRTQHTTTMHSGERPFKCAKCGKRFADEVTFERHCKKHTGEKPFPCSLCEKSFNHKNDLVRHNLNHTRRKPYKCAVCNKGFIRKDHMIKHTEIHKRKKRGT